MPDFRNKIVPIEADFSVDGLGLSYYVENLLMQDVSDSSYSGELSTTTATGSSFRNQYQFHDDSFLQVSVVFHMAAAVHFKQTIKNATMINVNVTRYLLDIAKNMKKLKVSC